jgi:seryl-tRNA(Sec) selenium transferase
VNAGNQARDVHERLGVRKLISAEGTVPVLGGCRMDPEVASAMAEAARHFVGLRESLVKSREHVAGLIGVEAALITAGAAAGLAITTAITFASC